MKIETISDFRAAIRHGSHAWPGGYPVYFVMADGEALSFEAAKRERRLLLDALAYPEYNRNDWRPVALEINWEDGNLICSHTDRRIESAYAEPDYTTES